MRYLWIFLYYIFGFIFADTCVVCGKIGSSIHTNCAKNITKKSNHPIWLITCFDYSDTRFKNLLLILKKSPRFDIAKILTKELSNKILNIITKDNYKNIIFIPIPASKKRKRKHGFNQAKIISEALAQNLLCKIKTTDAIKRTKETQKQSSLSKKERIKNMHNIFEIHKKHQTLIKDADIVFIIDDICTTGTTLLHAKQVLSCFNNNVRCVSLGYQKLC